MLDLSVIVPVRNAELFIDDCLASIVRSQPREIIVVDGNSTDGSIAAARRTLPWVRAITQTRRGKGNAMACGFAAATGDVIVMFDADGSADPTEIPAFVAALVAGADFAKGSRFATGGGSDDITLLRRTGNAGLNGVANALFGTSYTDLCYGYNAFWADLLPLLDLPDPAAPAPTDGMLWGDGFEIETVLNCRVAAAGLKITEVPSVERQRIFGRTNLRTFADGFRVLRTLAAERRRAVWARTHGAGRLTGPRVRPERFEAYGPAPYGAEAFAPSFDDRAYDGRPYDDRASGTGFPGAEPFAADEPRVAAFTPAGGIPVVAREPREPVAEPGAGRSTRPASRPHDRTAPVSPTPANRDRSGLRYALEEEPS